MDKKGTHVGSIDCAHPGGAVMDVENGVQHIFIYSGVDKRVCGIYRITRTLNTDKLQEAMEKVK